MRKIGISGHRTLTESTRRAVAAEIAALLAARGEAVQGWTSLAEGADAIFAWAVLAAGGELVFVPPSEDVEADFAGTPLAQFRAARALAVRTEPTPYAERSEEAYLEAGTRIVDAVDEMFLVWDGAPAVGRGGTGDIHAYCVRTGRPVEWIWPPGSTRPQP
jgi:hypothetical protein